MLIVEEVGCFETSLYRVKVIGFKIVPGASSLDLKYAPTAAAVTVTMVRRSQRRFFGGFCCCG